MVSSSARSAREPIFNLPSVVLTAILVLIGIHALRTWVLSEDSDLDLLLEAAVIPVRWAAAYGGLSAEEVMSRVAGAGAGDENLGPLQLEIAAHVLAHGGGKPWTAITYALLHGSWGHVAANSVWLAAFGTPVARRCGGARFAILACATAMGGAVAHALVHPFQALPMIGASAAVSGMMAAASWFIFARPVWLLDGRLAEPHERPREPIARMWADRRVLLFILVWFGTNFLFAALARPLGIADASIAWEAHVGGFATGLALFPWLDPIPRRAAA
jgi:membrane associated rhomboid family serine protease